jgi:hypothetical protein
MSDRSKPWPLDKYPLGCAGCGTTERAYEALGMCRRCYAKSKKGTLVLPVEVPPITDQPLDDPTPSSVDTFVTGETRPGSVLLSPGLTEPAGESPPDVEKKGLLGGLFDKREKKPKVTREPIITNEKKRPGNALSRKSAANDLEQLIGSIGARLARVNSQGYIVGKHYSLGQYLQWNAPATAEVIDENIKGTFIDKKFVQPLTKGKDRVGAIGGVVAPPVLIFAIESNHNLIGPLGPALYMAIEASLDSLLPAKKKADARAKKRADAIREAFGDDVPEGTDPVAQMIADMFPWAYDGSMEAENAAKAAQSNEETVHENAQ